MDAMNNYLDLLGREAKDVVTGFSGVCSSICFDLYGCVQAVLMPPVGKDGKAEDGRWFDTKRLQLKQGKRVMPLPAFEPAKVAGGQEKPAFARSPLG
jgi:hypothetical protein